MDTGQWVMWYGSEASAHEALTRWQGLLAQAPTLEPKAFSFYDDEEDEKRRFSGYDDLIQVQDKLAIVSISGPMAYKESVLTRYFQIMTYETISNLSAAIIADGQIEHVLFDIDSPGGMAKGISLASNALAELRRAGIGTTAHTTGEMLSGGYWVGSSADRVIVDSHSEIGSVGVIAVYHNISKMLEERGITTKVFRKGDEKGLGNPYEKLDDKAEQAIDRSLERSYQFFIDSVAAHRRLDSDFVRSQVATGRVFSAGEALGLGLVDGLKSFSQLVDSLLPSVGVPAQQPTGVRDMKNPIRAEAPAGLEPGATNTEDPVVAAAVGAAEPGAGAQQPEPQGEPAAQEPETQPEPQGSAGDPGPSSNGEAAQALSLLAQVNGQLVTAQVSLAQVTAERDALKAGNVGLRTIVLEQTKNLRIRMGQAAGSDLEGLSDTALVAAHNAVHSDFMSRFKGGPTSRVPDQDSPVPGAAVIQLTEASRRATQIRPTK